MIQNRTKRIWKNVINESAIWIILPSLLYGSENWTIKARDARIITAAHFKYIWEKQRDTLWADYKTNTNLPKKKLNKTPVLNKIQEYKKNLVANIQTECPVVE